MPYKNKSDQRECSRRHYKNNKQDYIERKNNRKKELRIWFKDYKKTLKCNRCPENHPACIEFHHKNGREKDDISVATMINRGWSKTKILNEINDKCEILCANCHNKIHYYKFY